MGNHKTIRATPGCSGRAAKIPVPTAPFTPGRQAAAGQGGGGPGLGPRRRNTGPGTEERTEVLFHEGGGARAAHRGGEAASDAATTARAPHALPSRTPHAVLTTLKRKEEPLRRRPPLSSHPHGPHWRHGSREAAAATADSKIRPLSPRAMLIGALGHPPLHRLEPRGQC